MAEQTNCGSCGMTIESGPYCQFCTDDHGELMTFEETFERMIQFARRRDASLDRATAEQKTLQYMTGMPAWSSHPRVASV